VAGALGLLAVATVTVAPPATAAEATFTIAEPALTSVTGMARDLTNSLFWMVQAGAEDATTVFGLDDTGSTVASQTFQAASPNATAVAWYADLLYIADIGDPALERESVTVHGIAVSEPALGKEVPSSAWQLVYPDGPHDAEALLVDPTGRLVVITTGADAAFYAAPDDLNAEQPALLQRLSTAPSGITDGLFLSDRLIAVRTSTAILTVDADTYEVTAEAPITTPGEGLALSADGTALVVSGRGPQATVATCPIPTDRVTPAAAEASEPVARPDRSGAGVSRSGTFIMLGAAVALAAGAGLLAFLKR
jgi:hypothetical protein